MTDEKVPNSIRNTPNIKSCFAGVHIGGICFLPPTLQMTDIPHCCVAVTRDEGAASWTEPLQTGGSSTQSPCQTSATRRLVRAKSRWGWSGVSSQCEAWAPSDRDADGRWGWEHNSRKSVKLSAEVHFARVLSKCVHSREVMLHGQHVAEVFLFLLLALRASNSKPKLDCSRLHQLPLCFPGSPSRFRLRTLLEPRF